MADVGPVLQNAGDVLLCFLSPHSCLVDIVRTLHDGPIRRNVGIGVQKPELEEYLADDGVDGFTSDFLRDAVLIVNSQAVQKSDLFLSGRSAHEDQGQHETAKFKELEGVCLRVELVVGDCIHDQLLFIGLVKYFEENSLELGDAHIRIQQPLYLSGYC